MGHARRANLRGSFLHNDRLPEACRRGRTGRSGPAVWWNGIGGMGRGARSRRSRAFFPSPHARVAAAFSDRSGRARGVAGPQFRSLIKCALPPLPPPQLAWPAPSSGHHQARNCDAAIPRASARAIQLDLLPLGAAMTIMTESTEGADRILRLMIATHDLEITSVCLPLRLVATAGAGGHHVGRRPARGRAGACA